MGHHKETHDDQPTPEERLDKRSSTVGNMPSGDDTLQKNEHDLSHSEASQK